MTGRLNSPDNISQERITEQQPPVTGRDNSPDNISQERITEQQPPVTGRDNLNMVVAKKIASNWQKKPQDGAQSFLGRGKNDDEVLLLKKPSYVYLAN